MDTINTPGVFCISLDFELHWGVCSQYTVADYQENLEGTRRAIQGMLSLFKSKQIHVTWATVGFLFFDKKEDLQAHLPQKLPPFTQQKYSSYRHIEQIGADEQSDPFHFAASVIEQIKAVPFQEMATHTFSHYFCLEEGPSISDFSSDLMCAQSVASHHQLSLESIVFPRNQYSEAHLEVCQAQGIRQFRGNPKHWLYAPRQRGDESIGFRAIRFLDSYINIAGCVTHPLPSHSDSLPINIPASRFLRPYYPKLAFMAPFQLRRIKKEMTLAAQKGHLYHLWWHPHNLGAHTQQNLEMLEKILSHYEVLSSKYGMKSLNMKEVGNV